MQSSHFSCIQILFADTLGHTQKLMRALEEFCICTILSVNSNKTNITTVKSPKKDKPCITYNNERLKIVESFKYVGLEAPSNHKP